RQFAGCGFHAQIEAAAVVDGDQLDGHEVTLFDDVTRLVDALLAHFGHVHQAVLARHNLDERTEVHDVDDRHIFVDGAHFGVIGDALDPLDGGGDALTVG